MRGTGNMGILGLALLDLSHLFHMLPAFEIAIIS